MRGVPGVVTAVAQVAAVMWFDSWPQERLPAVGAAKRENPNEEKIDL